jgi:hypothetical protein
MLTLNVPNSRHVSWTNWFLCWLILGSLLLTSPLAAQNDETDPFGDPLPPATTVKSVELPVVKEFTLVVQDNMAANEADIDKAHASIQQKLLQKIDLHIPTAEFGSVIETLAKKLDINIIVDPVGLEEAGVTLNQIISHEFRGITAKSALKNMLRRLNLTYFIQNEVLEINSVGITEGPYQTKVYDCRDLLELIPKVPARREAFGTLNGGGGFGTGAAPMKPQPTSAEKASNDPFSDSATLPESAPKSNSEQLAKEMVYDGDKLVELISDSIGPELWRDEGGKGTIHHFNTMIVVHHTAEAHEQIEKLLISMRELAKQK